MLEKEFEALKTYDWGASPKVLDPIEQAAVAVLGDPAAGKDLEVRLTDERLTAQSMSQSGIRTTL